MRPSDADGHALAHGDTHAITDGNTCTDGISDAPTDGHAHWHGSATLAVLASPDGLALQVGAVVLQRRMKQFANTTSGRAESPHVSVVASPPPLGGRC